VIAPKVDSSLVTFEPYFLYRAGEQPCQTLVSFAPVYWDTTVNAPGLSATFSGYEMRASSGDIRTFGEVLVSAVSTGRTNAGGGASVERDTNGCTRVKPAAGLSTGYVLENPPDTISRWSAFVQGYLYDATTPVCGELRVFHLLARD
jgi:hypothetical protein